MNFLLGMVAGIALTLIVFFARKPGRLPADTWLIGLLVSLTAIAGILALANELPGRVVALAGGPLFLLPPACLLIYVRRLTGHGARFEWLALAPGILWAGAMLAQLEGTALLPPVIPVLTSLVFPALGVATLIRYRTRLLDRVSTLNGIDLIWLMYLQMGVIAGTLAGAVLVLCMGVANSFQSKALFAGVMTIVIAQLLLAAWFGLRQMAVPLLPKAVEPAPPTQEDFDRIVRVMGKDQPWLEPEMRLEDLARAAKLPERTVSAAINRIAGKNFFRFVNEYRVQEARDLMDRPENRSKTLLDIAFEAGFASKPSFNRVFKTITGQTPREWRARVRPD